MANINELNCDVNRKNVGYGSCVLTPDLIKGAILYLENRIFTPEELDDLQTTLQSDAWEDSPSERGFPIHGFLQMNDNTEDVQIQTFDYGTKAKTRDGDYDWQFQFLRGGVNLLSAFRSLEGNIYALFYDANGVIYGTENNDRLSTIPVQFFALPWRPPTGSAAAQFLIRFIFRPEYLNDSLAFTKKITLSQIESVVGLKDVNIIVNSFDDTTGVANITLMQRIGSINLYELYATELANVARYLATNQDTGAAITITTVTGQASNKSFNVTLDTGDTDYPTDGVIELTLAAPSVLEAAGVAGYAGEKAELEVVSS